jgi:hypothetical protein
MRRTSIAELQPAEPLWPLVREAVADKGFAELEVMEPVLVERWRGLIDHPEVVRGAVGFDWAVAIIWSVIQAMRIGGLLPDRWHRFREGRGVGAG